MIAYYEITTRAAMQITFDGIIIFFFSRHKQPILFTDDDDFLGSCERWL